MNQMLVPRLRLAFLAVTYLALLYVAAMQNRPILSVVDMGVDNFDFRNWFSGMQKLSDGNDPYSVSPPWMALPVNFYLLLPLQVLSVETAKWVFALVSVSAIVAGTVIFCRSSLEDSHGFPTRLTLSLGFVFLGAPTVLLIERGTSHSLVYCFVALALAMKREVIAGLSLAAAIVLKLYAAVLLIPFLFTRSWRLVASCLALVACALAVGWPFLMSFEEALGARSRYVVFYENLSVHGIFTYFEVSDFGLQVFSVLFGLFIAMDWILLRKRLARSSHLALLASYTILMCMQPRVVIWYTGIVLVLFFLALDSQILRSPRWFLVLVSSLQALTFAPAWSFVAATDVDFFHIVPALALCGLAALAILLRIALLRPDGRVSTRFFGHIASVSPGDRPTSV